MPFVKRSADGKIVGVFSHATEEGLEEIDGQEPELGQFLSRAQLIRGVLMEWIESDLSMIRVIEDLIEVLIDRNVICFTDFPEAAQRKVLQRRGLRNELAYVKTLFDSEQGPVEPDGDGETENARQFF